MVIKSMVLMCEHAFITITCMSCYTDFSVPVWCGNRLCVICQQVRSNRYSAYFKNKIKNVLSCRKVVRFITLTVKNTPTLSEGYRDLCKGWKRLRQTKLWKQKVDGGALSIEVTNNGNGWHVHLHIIYEGAYINENKLSQEWRRVTPSNSYIVRIRGIRGYREAIRYLSKYPFKPNESQSWNDGQRYEYNGFMQGKRLFRTFQTWYGDKLRGRTKVCPACGIPSQWFIQELEGIKIYHYKNNPYPNYSINDYG